MGPPDESPRGIHSGLLPMPGGHEARSEGATGDHDAPATGHRTRRERERVGTEREAVARLPRIRSVHANPECLIRHLHPGVVFCSETVDFETVVFWQRPVEFTDISLFINRRVFEEGLRPQNIHMILRLRCF